MTPKWKIRRIQAEGVTVWRLSCPPLGVYGHYRSWAEAIERAEYWSKRPEQIGWHA